jgi:hypothetical protein
MVRSHGSSCEGLGHLAALWPGPFVGEGGAAEGVLRRLDYGGGLCQTSERPGLDRPPAGAGLSDSPPAVWPGMSLGTQVDPAKARSAQGAGGQRDNRFRLPPVLGAPRDRPQPGGPPERRQGGSPPERAAERHIQPTRGPLVDRLGPRLARPGHARVDSRRLPAHALCGATVLLHDSDSTSTASNWKATLATLPLPAEHWDAAGLTVAPVCGPRAPLGEVRQE